MRADAEEEVGRRSDLRGLVERSPRVVLDHLPTSELNGEAEVDELDLTGDGVDGDVVGLDVVVGDAQVGEVVEG